MAWDIIGPKSSLADDSCDLEFFNFARHEKLLSPLLKDLEGKFYSKTIVHAGQVPQLRLDLKALHIAYRDQVAPKFSKSKKIHAQSKEKYEELLESVMLREDRLYRFIISFINICDEAIKLNAPIKFEGD